MKNLYFEAECLAVVHEMERELVQWLITTTRPKTVLGSGREANAQEVRRYNNVVSTDGKLDLERVRALAGGNYI